MTKRKGLSFNDVREMTVFRRLRAEFNAWKYARARRKRIEQLAKPGAKVADIIKLMGVV